MSIVTGSKLANQTITSPIHTENAPFVRDITANKVTGSFAGILAEKLTLQRLPTSSQGLIEEHIG